MLTALLQRHPSPFGMSDAPPRPEFHLSPSQKRLVRSNRWAPLGEKELMRAAPPQFEEEGLLVIPGFASQETATRLLDRCVQGPRSPLPTLSGAVR